MGSPEWERTEEERKVAKVLEEVAAEVGAPNIQAGEWPVYHVLVYTRQESG